MTPSETYAALSKTINEELLRLGALQDRHAKAVLARIKSLLNSSDYRLDLYPDGRIRPTSTNLSKINGIVKQAVGKIYARYWITGLDRRGTPYEQIQSINDAYLTGQGIGFKGKPRFNEITKTATNAVIGSITTEETRSYLERPIRNLLSEYIRTGGGFFDMVDTLEKAITNEVITNKTSTNVDEKAIERTFRGYHDVKRVARDTMFGFTRSYIEAVSDDLGFKFYRYMGGLVEESRGFCADRSGKTWHIDEINTWPSLTWEGKIPNTNTSNIKNRLGGYNCRHTLLPVGKRKVPKSDMDRMVSLGLDVS